jgi:hypothetical protein
MRSSINAAFSASADQSEPKPCKRYAKRMLLNARFVAHLSACNVCMGVLTQLNRESEMKLYAYENEESE